MNFNKGLIWIDLEHFVKRHISVLDDLLRRSFSWVHISCFSFFLKVEIHSSLLELQKW